MERTARDALTHRSADGPLADLREQGVNNSGAVGEAVLSEIARNRLKAHVRAFAGDEGIPDILEPYQLLHWCWMSRSRLSKISCCRASP